MADHDEVLSLHLDYDDQYDVSGGYKLCPPTPNAPLDALGAQVDLAASGSPVAAGWPGVSLKMEEQRWVMPVPKGAFLYSMPSAPDGFGALYWVAENYDPTTLNEAFGPMCLYLLRDDHPSARKAPTSRAPVLIDSKESLASGGAFHQPDGDELFVVTDFVTRRVLPTPAPRGWQYVTDYFEFNQQAAANAIDSLLGATISLESLDGRAIDPDSWVDEARERFRAALSLVQDELPAPERDEPPMPLERNEGTDPAVARGQEAPDSTRIPGLAGDPPASPPPSPPPPPRHGAVATRHPRARTPAPGPRPPTRGRHARRQTSNRSAPLTAAIAAIATRTTTAMHTTDTAQAADTAEHGGDHTTAATAILAIALTAAALATTAAAAAAAWRRRPGTTRHDKLTPQPHATPREDTRAPEWEKPAPTPPPSPPEEHGETSEGAGHDEAGRAAGAAAETQEAADSEPDDEDDDPDAGEEGLETAPLVYRIAEDGSLKGDESYRLPARHGDTPLVFGREPGEHGVILTDEARIGKMEHVSRVQATIYVGADGQLYVQANSTIKVTWLNETPLHHIDSTWQQHTSPPALLADGDVLRLGGQRQGATRSYAMFMYYVALGSAEARRVEAYGLQRDIRGTPPTLSGPPTRRARPADTDPAPYGVPYLKGCFRPRVFSAYDTSF